MAEFAAGTHGGDADTGGAPASESANFGDGFFLEVEEADDHLFAWFEGREKFSEDFTGEGGAALGGLGRSGLSAVEVEGFVNAEFVVGDDGAFLLAPESVVAGVESDAGNPVLEGLFGGELVKAGEDFEEDVLRDVLFAFGAGKVSADDGNDERVEPVHQLARDVLVALAGGFEQFSFDGVGGGFHG